LIGYITHVTAPILPVTKKKNGVNTPFVNLWNWCEVLPLNRKP